MSAHTNGASVNPEELVTTLNSTTKSTFTNNDSARQKTLLAARALISRLEQPWERIYYLSLIQPPFLAALTTARDLNLFSYLSSRPSTCSDLAATTNCDPALLIRILRVLVASQWIDEVEIGKYVSNDHSEALKDPNGLVNGIDLFYDEGHRTMTRLPQYFAAHKYRNPTSYVEAPWKWINDVPTEDYEKITRWQWMETHKNQARHLDAFLSSLRRDQTPLNELYDFSNHLKDFDPSAPFLVDVGGGKGRDISNVATIAPPNTKLILQDRPEVLSNIRTPLPKIITLQPHDFFTPNPTSHAKLYFEHSVLHDWPDKEAREIILGIKAAMKPGYSKLVMMERIMPARASEASIYVAVMDLQMMNNFAALERTEQQWRELVESVGLKFLGVKGTSGGEGYGFMEAEL